VFGLVAPLYEMANVIAARLSGDTTAEFKRATLATRLKVTGIDLFSAGDFAPGEGRQDVVLRDPKRGIYKRLVLKQGRLIGAVLYGDTSDGSRLFGILQQGGVFNGSRDALMFGFAPGMAA
jgi:nitrite reductase (NADH) large subunit